jgi:poly(3-hydroxyalkanoate) synthetase
VNSLFDVNLLGDDLNVWTYETTRKMVRYGHVGVLVDAPADGGRPYWVTYTPRQILGWRAEQQEGQAGANPTAVSRDGHRARR